MARVANYTAVEAVVDGFAVYRLEDAACQTEVSVARTIGNNAYEMKVRGRHILAAPPNLGHLRQKPVHFGNPFMAPWANRLEADAFHANGKRYALNSSLGNFLRDNRGLAIHGLLTNWPQWEMISLTADEHSAQASCRLEFWKHPDLIAQFPFAHVIVVTHRLKNGVLEVETRLENKSTEPMPVSLGFHPYFQVPDAPRDSWMIHFPTGDELLLSETFIPTGAKRPLRLPDPAAIAGLPSMHLLSNLARRADGGAEFWVEGGGGRVTLVQGRNYPVSVVYAPPGENYVCFEPMAATINALNPMADGSRPGIQSVAPGGTWQESFWIRYSNVHPNPGA